MSNKKPNLLADAFAREMSGMRNRANRHLAVYDLTLDANDNIVSMHVRPCRRHRDVASAMTAAERAIADMLTFRRHWGDAWAFERLDTAALEIARARSLTTQAARGVSAALGHIDLQAVAEAYADEPDLPPIGRETFRRPKPR